MNKFTLSLECFAPISLLIFDNDYMNNNRLLRRKSFFFSFRLKIFKLFFRFSERSSTLIKFFRQVDRFGLFWLRAMFVQSGKCKVQWNFLSITLEPKHWSGATSCFSVLCILALGSSVSSSVVLACRAQSHLNEKLSLDNKEIPSLTMTLTHSCIIILCRVIINE